MNFNSDDSHHRGYVDDESVVSSLGHISVDDDNMTGSSTDDSLMVTNSSIDFYMKYAKHSSDSDMIDMTDPTNSQIDTLDTAILQTHILDGIVSLLRIQSMQSKEIQDANALRNKLFSQVVHTLLPTLSNAVENFTKISSDPAESINAEEEKPKVSVHTADEAIHFNKGMQLLLKAFPNENKSKDGSLWLPIHWCMALESTNNFTGREMRQLLSSDPLSIMRCANNATPAHIVSTMGNFKSSILKLKNLVEFSGPSIAGIPNNDNDLPIHYACTYSDSIDIIKYLLELNSSNTRSGGLDDLTPINCAVECGRSKDIIKLLTAQDPESICIPDCKGNTPLHVIASVANTIEDLDTFLIMCRACPDALMVKNIEAVTPFHFFCKNPIISVLHDKSFLLMQYILTVVPEVAVAQTSTGLLPIHFACETTGSAAMVKMLIKSISDVTPAESSYYLKTPLIHFAVKGDNIDIISYLYQTDTSCFLCPNEDGLYPIHIAVLYASLDVCKYIINAHPRCLFSLTRLGKLPIHLFIDDLINEGSQEVDIDDVDMLQLLLSHKASVVVKDTNNNSVIDIFPSSGSKEIRRLLLMAAYACKQLKEYHLRRELFELNYSHRRIVLYLAYVAVYRSEKRCGIVKLLRMQSLNLLKHVVAYL